MKIRYQEDNETLEILDVLSFTGDISDDAKVIFVDMSDDEEYLFGHFLDDGYWIQCFEEEGITGVQKKLSRLQLLPSLIDGLADSMESIFNEYPYDEMNFVKNCESDGIYRNELAEHPAAYAKEELFEVGLDGVNEEPFTQFIDYEGLGEELIENLICQQGGINVNGHFYQID